MAVIDNSFLRFETSINAAMEVGNPIVANIWRKNSICLLPTDFYLQITKTPEGMDFGGDIKAYLVDCHDVVLAEITNNVAISQFTDTLTGLTQCKIELAYLNLDFYSKPVQIRLDKYTSSLKWWSNSFNLTSQYERSCIRLDYGSPFVVENINYPVAQVIQSISIRGFETDPDDRSEQGTYDAFTIPSTIGTSVQNYWGEKYICEYLDKFTYRALRVALSHPLLYVQLKRSTYAVGTLTKEDRRGATNQFRGTFSTSDIREEEFTPALQVFEILHLTQRSPEGLYTISTLPNAITATFDQNVTLGIGTVVVKDSEGTIIATYTQDDIELTGASFSITAFAGLITENGAYTITVNSGLFTSASGFQQNSTETWSFTVITGYYDHNYYQPANYLTD